MVRYNGVTLPWQLTLSVDQRPVRDPSNTDQIGTDYTVSYSATLSAGSLPVVAGESLAEACKRLEHSLREDRKEFRYDAPDTSKYLHVYPASYAGAMAAGSFIDVHNGPFVREATVTEVAEAAVTIRLTVCFRIQDCPDQAGDRPDPTVPFSHRWEESVGYDADWRAVHRRNGVLVLPPGSDADSDAFRSRVFSPAPPVGFRRRAAEYTIDPTGLLVRYRYEDEELVRPPPYPATRMRGRQVETSPFPGGKRIGQIDLTLTGPKTVHQKELLNAAIRACMSRIFAAGVITTPVNPGQSNSQAKKALTFAVGMAIQESLDDDKCQVSLSLQWLLPPVMVREKGLDDQVLRGGPRPRGSSPPPPATPLFKQNDQGRDQAAVVGDYAGWVGREISGVSPARVIDTPTRGTADALRLAAAALNDPCGLEASLTTLPWGNDVVERYFDNRLFRLHRGPVTPDDVQGKHRDDGPGISTLQSVQTFYLDHPGTVVLPSTLPGEPAGRVQLHAGFRTLRAKWSAERVGGPPVVPDPTPKDDNWVYLKGTVSPSQVELAADGVSLVYRVEGVYDYQAVRQEDVAVAAPMPPYLASELRAEAAEPVRLSGDILPAAGQGVYVFPGQVFELRGGPTLPPPP